MPSVTRAQARGQRVEDPTQATASTQKTPKNQENPRSKRTPKASKPKKTPKSQKRSKKTRVPSLIMPAHSSPLGVSPGEIPLGCFTDFRPVKWNQSSSVAESPQMSPKSTSHSQATVLGKHARSSGTSESTNSGSETTSTSRPPKKRAKTFLRSRDQPHGSATSSSSKSPRVAAIKRLEIKNVSPNTERAPCLSPSCPLYPTPHQQGTYLHGGQSPRNHTTFGWSNPPPEIWAAHQKNRHDEATEAELELIANFRAHHDQRVQNGGITTSGICQNEPVPVRQSSFIIF